MTDRAPLSTGNARKPKRKRKPIRQFPLRQCQTLHECYICDGKIILGDLYYDGGYGRRAHEVCAHG